MPTAVSDVAARLRAAGCVFAEDEAALLIAAGPGDLDALVARRVAGEPLEYVLGWAEFAGRRYTVAAGVFVPRPRSVLLVERAATGARPDATVLDLGCGVGAIGLAVVDRLGPRATLHAVDVDPLAVRCARANLGDRGTVYVGDLDAPVPADLRGRVDILVANAPYVPTDEIALLPREARDYEHRVALDGGPDGVAVHRRIAALAPRWLAPDGRLLIETGAHQAELTAAAVADHDLGPEIVSESEATVVIGRR